MAAVGIGGPPARAVGDELIYASSISRAGVAVRSTSRAIRSVGRAPRRREIVLALVEALCSDRWFVAGDLYLIDAASGEKQRIETNAYRRQSYGMALGDGAPHRGASPLGVGGRDLRRCHAICHGSVEQHGGDHSRPFHLRRRIRLFGRLRAHRRRLRARAGDRNPSRRSVSTVAIAGAG